MTEQDNTSLEPISHEIQRKRAQVRIWVTYAFTGMYFISGLGLISYLAFVGKTEVALATFTSIASLTSGVVGFWFGNFKLSEGLKSEVSSLEKIIELMKAKDNDS